MSIANRGISIPATGQTKTLRRNKKMKKIFTVILTVVLLLSAMLPQVYAEGDTDSGSAPLDPPQLETAKAALIYCVQADKVVWSSGENDSRYPAGSAKMMTALLAIEHYNGNMDAQITATASALRTSSGNNINLRAGEIMTARDLIAAVIVTGANDAACVLATEIAGTVNLFVGKMNGRAAELGMESTKYTNPTGMYDSGMTTTAGDIIKLARYCYFNSTFMEYAGANRYTIAKTNYSSERTMANRNYFINIAFTNEYYYSIINGMSISYTEQSGYNIIASAQYNGVDYIAVALGCEDVTETISEAVTEIDPETGEEKIVTPAETKDRNTSYADAKSLIRWAIRNYSFQRVIDVSTIICEIPVTLGTNIDHVTLLPEHAVEIYMPNNEKAADVISYTWTLSKESLAAPVEMGEEAGVLYVSYKGQPLEEVKLVAKNNVERSEWLYLLNEAKDFTKTPLFRITAIVLIILTAVYFISTSVKRKKRTELAKREFMKKHRKY